MTEMTDDELLERLERIKSLSKIECVELHVSSHDLQTLATACVEWIKTTKAREWQIHRLREEHKANEAQTIRYAVFGLLMLTAAILV